MNDFLEAENDIDVSDILEWIHDQDSDHPTGEWDDEPEDDLEY